MTVAVYWKYYRTLKDPFPLTIIYFYFSSFLKQSKRFVLSPTPFPLHFDWHEWMNGNDTKFHLIVVFIVIPFFVLSVECLFELRTKIYMLIVSNVLHVVHHWRIRDTLIWITNCIAMFMPNRQQSVILHLALMDISPCLLDRKY